MGSTITEKIVSRAVGRTVKAGELIEALPVDKLYFNEVIGPPAILNFQKDFGDVYQDAGRRMKVFDPSESRVHARPHRPIVLDHGQLGDQADG